MVTYSLKPEWEIRDADQRGFGQRAAYPLARVSWGVWGRRKHSTYNLKLGLAVLF